MIKVLNLVVEAFVAAQKRRAQASMLSQLDERTLRDIGLELEANSARARGRRLDLRFGMY